MHEHRPSESAKVQLIDQEAGIFSIEASLMTTEVKSKLTANELQQADASARVAAKLHHALASPSPWHGQTNKRRTRTGTSPNNERNRAW